MNISLVERVKRYSKASEARLQTMEKSLRTLDHESVTGDVVECGVWRGGHIILARLVSPQRVCWAYDTFEGMPAPGPYDMKRSGHKPPPTKALSKKWTMASMEEVMDNFTEEGVWDEGKIKMVPGMVEKTLLDPINIPDAISLLRLDTDWYESTKIELEVLWPRLVSGGFLIVDDYGHWMGSRKAVDDYFHFTCPDYITSLQMIDYTAMVIRK
jgi:O-methyltransferase